MSKHEINFIRPSEYNNSRFMPLGGLSLVSRLWWRFMPGVVISVPWPKTDYVSFGTYKVLTCDPNDHHRPWLEKYVGRQKWDWDWGCSCDNEGNDFVLIKFRKKHAKYATMAKLIWS